MTPIWTTDVRVARQHSLELDMAKAGRAAAQKVIDDAAKAGHMERTAGGDAALRKFLVPATNVIHRWRNREHILAADLGQAVIDAMAKMGKKPGRTADHILLVKGLASSEIAAHLLGACASTVEDIDSRGALRSHHKQITALGNRLESAAYLAWVIATGNENLIHDNAKRAERGGWNADGKRLNLHRSVAEHVGEWPAWTPTARMKLAAELFSLAEGHLGLLESETVPAGKEGTRTIYRATAPLFDLIAARTNAVLDMAATVSVFACPPLDWTAAKRGAFHTVAVHEHKLVRTRFTAQLAEIDARILRSRADGTTLPFLTALNAVQATAWRINPTVYATFAHFWGAKAGVAGLPVDADPFIPSKEGWDALPPEEIKERAKERSDALGLARKALPGRRAVSGLADQCSTIQADPLRSEAFWFAYNTDYRGRLLPLQTGLQPQGSKLAKALLEFAEGKAIVSQAGADWLAIHTANEWGMDKLDMAARIEWSNRPDTVALMHRIANDPIGTSHLWGGIGAVDKLEPWMALRAALEWSAFKHTGRGFVSHIPVAIDGTCNGLQHLSAMTRDAVCGEHVNLWGTKRGDVYARIADAANARLAEIVQWQTFKGVPVTDSFAKQTKKDEKLGKPREVTVSLADKLSWAGSLHAYRFERADAKKAAMTIPYGAGMQACLKDIEAGMVASIKSGKKVSPWGDDLKDGKGMRSWGAQVLFAGVTENVGSAMRVLRWLEAASKPLSTLTEPKPMTWGTPSGFYVHQEIRRKLDADKNAAAMIRVRGTDGVKSCLKLAIDIPGTINPADQAQKMAPNFVHSYDAAHLSLTVEACLAAGVTSFATIHDSFGTHAEDAAALHEHTLATFGRIYSRKVLVAQAWEWRRSIRTFGGSALPAPPACGKWNPLAPINPHFFS